ncbi:MAG: aldo/keto reductase [Candidatus Thorarchaeota archaeon]|jgi:aryl-alcohol dehydrogenase-like predicted oxidoreductase
MDYAKLGRTGLKVSRFILGTMQMGWIVNEEDSFKLLDAALEAGITTLDTADIYSKWGEGSHAGKSEEILGRWIKNRDNRDDLIIATKVRGEMSEKPNDAGLSRAHVLSSADRSLNRMQTEWIDLYQSHWFDSDVPQEETLSAYTKLIDDGVVNYIGASNFTAAELVESFWVSDKNGFARYDSLQPPYSLARRRDYEKHLEPVITKYGLGVINYSPLGGGFLTGKYTKDATPDSKRAQIIGPRYGKERNYRIVETLTEMAATHDASIAQIALAWILTKETVTAPIIGVNTVEQLNQNLGVFEIKLSDDDLNRMNTVSNWEEMDFLAR